MSGLPDGWAPNTTVLGAGWAALDPDVQAAALSVACAELWALSGRRFGTRTVRIAPYVRRIRPWYADTPGLLPFWGISALGTVVGPDAASPSHDRRAFRLPGPVVSVASVTLGGVVLDPSGWTVEPGGRLILLGTAGADGWRVAQDVYADPPGWTVTYTRGTPVPDEAQVAAARYAVAIAHGLGAPGQDRIPGRARDVTRAGTSIQLADPTAVANAGLTGVPLVDAWLRTVNPNRLSAPAALWSPDMERHRYLPVAP